MIIDISEFVFNTYSENYWRKNKQFEVVRARLDKDLTAFGCMEGINIGTDPKELMEDDIVKNAGLLGLFSNEALQQHIFTYKGVANYLKARMHMLFHWIRKMVLKNHSIKEYYTSIPIISFLFKLPAIEVLRD